MHRLPVRLGLALAALSLALAPAMVRAQSGASNTPTPATANAATAPAGGLRGVDVIMSTVMTPHQSSFAGLALRARLQSARIIPQIEFMPSLEYWRNTSEVPSYDITATRKDATLSFDTRYNFVTRGMRPYLGAGWALHFMSSTVDAPSLGIHNADDSLTKGNLAALGGIAFPMNDRIDNIIELKYHFLSDLRQFKINWGIAFHL